MDNDVASSSAAKPSADANVGAQASTSKPSAVVPRDYLVEPGGLRPSPLSGSRDLVTLFGLESTYDTYLRPYLPESITSVSGTSSNEVGFKGKGKQAQGDGGEATSVFKATTSGGIGITLGGIKIGEAGTATGTGDVDQKKGPGGGRRLKMEKNYSYLVQDVPGRNTIKKDHFLRNLVMNPDFQAPAPLVAAAKALQKKRHEQKHALDQADDEDSDSIGTAARVAGFDEQTLREAFTLKAGFPIPGFDMLIWESNTEAPGHKKKKKRKHFTDPSVNPSAGGADDEHRQKKIRRE
ncbi:hypothetical protein OIV83_002742 [Microbotryomycetes sp. JL201]|nr:hypothetical protein OIV83_002742 [Microbotryomycetes sp. JL201]